MKKELQRIAIAEACGWKSEFVAVPDGDEGDTWLKPDGFSGELPDYLNDLNSMHAAEKTMRFSTRQTYLQRLAEVMSKGLDRCVIAPCELAFATAPERAEAFLKTIGKWVEE